MYNKLLSARCVQQQIETIQQQQVQVEEADAAAGQQRSKQSTLSSETAPVHTNRHAGSGVTNACSNFQEPAPHCSADALKPVMALHTDEQTADAAAAAVACIRYGFMHCLQTWHTAVFTVYLCIANGFAVKGIPCFFGQAHAYARLIAIVSDIDDTCMRAACSLQVMLCVVESATWRQVTCLMLTQM